MKYTLTVRYILPFVFLLMIAFGSTAQTDPKYQKVDGLIKTNSMIDALDALNILKKNYQQDTADAAYWLRYSQVSYILYKYDDAKSSIDKAIRLDPQAVYYFEKGLLYNRLNNPDAALKALETAVKLKEEGEYFYWRGVVNQQLGNKQFAEMDFREALKHQFETAEMQNYFAIVLFENNKMEEGLRQINRAILLDNKFAEAYSSRAKIHLFLFDIDSACSDNTTAFSLGYKKIVHIPDSVCKGSFTQRTQFVADICAGSKFYEQAIIGYTKLIDKKIIKSDYFLNRGYCYFQLGKHAEAEKDYLKALTLPKVALDMVYNNLSLLYFDQKEYHKSIEYTTKRIELNPLNDQAYLDRGLCYRKMKIYKEAEKDYDKAISIKPDFSRAYAYKAFLYMEEGRFEKALELASTAIQISPKYGYAYLVRAQIKQRLDLPDFCVDYYAAKNYLEPDADEAIRRFCK